MKKILLLVGLLFILTSGVVMADTPEQDALNKAPELYIIASQYGVSPTKVSSLWIKFNNTYGSYHNLEGDLWGMTQQIRLNLFAQSMQVQPFYTCGEDFCARSSYLQEKLNIYKLLYAD